MNRINCVICNNKSIKKNYQLNNYPLCRHSSLSIENDIHADLIFGTCDNCSCLQLITLQDPYLLYKQHNNQTFVTSFWMDHHIKFALFILNNINKLSNIIEIGGKTGILAKQILEVEKHNYTIIDICDSDNNIPGVIFKNENAEESLYNEGDIVIMSHVFEHLYNPRDFIQKLYNAKVCDIFISIPNMRSLLEKSVLLLVNVEHTFYCDMDYCRALFESNGYKYVDNFYFNDHSIFFHFRIDRPIQIVWNNISSLKTELNNYFISIEKLYKNIIINKPFYIAPAGYYGQMIYYLLSSNTNIIGFLDNDITKNGQRVYGTPKYIEYPNILVNMKGPTILISASLYSKDIIDNFLRFNNNINFINI